MFGRDSVERIVQVIGFKLYFVGEIIVACHVVTRFLPGIAPGEHLHRQVGAPAALRDGVLDLQAGAELRRISDTYGPESIACVVQVAGTGHVAKGAISRIATLNGWAMMGGYEMNGDLLTSTEKEITSYVLSRRITGIQALNDEFTANAENVKYTERDYEE